MTYPLLDLKTDSKAKTHHTDKYAEASGTRGEGRESRNSPLYTQLHTHTVACTHSGTHTQFHAHTDVTKTTQRELEKGVSQSVVQG